VKLPHDIAGRIALDPKIWADFEAICDTGGRLAGTASEAAALEFVRKAGADATGVAPSVVPTPYPGWSCEEATLELINGDRRIPLTCLPLVRSASGEVEAEVVDVGRGTPGEFAASAGVLKGRIALVRHEYMFASGHIHRREKYAAAMAAGAVGFLIASPLATSPVAGSSGRGNEPGIPAMGICPEAAARLSPPFGHAAVRMVVKGTEYAKATEAVIFDIPGQTNQWVVLTAHIDGHTPAESALDNASGAAVALGVARALAPLLPKCKRGLRLVFFSAEEWALTGSREWIGGLEQAEIDAMVLNVNLDSVAGSPNLTALTSGFDNLPEFVRKSVADTGVAIDTHPVLMKNSDHANFAEKGVPALRLVAGFNELTSNVRHVLTAADTRDKASRTELTSAAEATALLCWNSLNASDGDMKRLRVRTDP